MEKILQGSDKLIEVLVTDCQGIQINLSDASIVNVFASLLADDCQIAKYATDITGLTNTNQMIVNLTTNYQLDIAINRLESINFPVADINVLVTVVYTDTNFKDNQRHEKHLIKRVAIVLSGNFINP